MFIQYFIFRAECAFGWRKTMYFIQMLSKAIMSNFHLNKATAFFLACWGCLSSSWWFYILYLLGGLLSVSFAASGEWSKLHYAELHALYSSPNIIRSNVKSIASKLSCRMDVTRLEQRSCIKIAVFYERKCHRELVVAVGNNYFPFLTVARWVAEFQRGCE